MQQPSRQFITGMYDQEKQEFQNEFFVQGKEELVGELKRHIGIRKSRIDKPVKRKMISIEEYVETKLVKSNHDDERQVISVDSQRAKQFFLYFILQPAHCRF